nr:immunoglobulin light chain junction region [Macaca mulatta]
DYYCATWHSSAWIF